MYFLQISDSHHLNSYENTPDGFHDAFLRLHSFREKLELLQKTLTKPIDFICHCGDICHGGQIQDYIFAKKCIEDCFPTIPLFVTVGNHDQGDLVEKVFIQGKGRSYHTKVGDLQIISLDNTDENHVSGEITREDCQWLLKVLENQTDSLLLCHHHLIPGQNVMPTANIDPLLQKVLAQNNVKAILTGHTHYAYEGKMGNIPYYAVDSFCFHGTDRGEGHLHLHESSGYQVFSYEKGKITLEETGNLGFSDYLGTATL